jgi:hypothetical protein
MPIIEATQRNFHVAGNYSIIKNPPGHPFSAQDAAVLQMLRCPAVPRWSTLAPSPCPFSRGLRGFSDQTKSNMPINIASHGDETLDPAQELAKARRDLQCFRGSRPELGAKTKVPSVAARARALQTKSRPRPPTAVSNPTETKQSQKSNAASSQTGVRPPPPLRSLTPTHLMDSAAARGLT